MFNLEENDLVRIERSPYLNGHYYLRFLKKGCPKNIELSRTVGFGYDFKVNDTVNINAAESYIFGGYKSYSEGTLDSCVIKA